MTARISIPLLILVIAAAPYGKAQEVIGVDKGGTGSASGGAVIEIGPEDNSEVIEQTGGGSISGETSQPVNITRNPGNTGIEFIVGGQGQDGIAKRSHLPVVE